VLSVISEGIRRIIISMPECVKSKHPENKNSQTSSCPCAAPPSSLKQMRYYALHSFFFIFVGLFSFSQAAAMYVAGARTRAVLRKLNELTKAAPHQAHQQPPAHYQP
jgi:hypothetical protein